MRARAFAGICLSLLLSSGANCQENNILGEEPPLIPSSGLSPWELHTVNDLAIDVAILHCPRIDAVSARSFKDFISTRIALLESPSSHFDLGDRTISEFMNPQFYPMYKDLVHCTNNLLNKKLSTQKRGHPSANEAKEDKWEEEDKAREEHESQMSQSQTLTKSFREKVYRETLKFHTERPRQKLGSKKDSEEDGIFKRGIQWFKNIITKGDLAFPRTKKEQAEAKIREWEGKWGQRKLEAMTEMRNVLRLLIQIGVSPKVCSNLRDVSVADGVVGDILGLFTINDQWGIGLGVAVDVYLKKKGLLQQVQECFQGLQQ